MKKSITALLILAMVVCLCSCQSTKKEYYENTELKKLETFTSITGIELNISEDAPESNSTTYNYLMDNDAAGLSAVTKYETYLKEYGFEKSDALSNRNGTVYLKDGFIIVSGSFNPQANVLQYVINIPSQPVKTDTEPPEDEQVDTPQKDNAALYAEFCGLVDGGEYTKAVEYADTEKLSMEYEDAKDYYHYAEAMKLYKETEFFTYKDVLEVIRILTDDVPDGFKDSADIVEKINSELSALIGHTYICKRDSRYALDAFYLTVADNGEIVLDAGAAKDGKPKSNYADYELVYVNLEEAPYYMICDDTFTDIDDCSYAITIQSDQIILSRAWGDKYTDGMYSGVYKKLS